MTLLEHALWLARECGFSVFPLRPRTKVPATTNGCKDATRDPAQIEAWWSFMPEANIGIATGGPSGVLVIDVDGTEGAAALEALGAIEPTLEVITPGSVKNGVWQGKGRHLYYVHVPGVTIGQSKVALHVDHRGDGGYVVAPPSVHPDGTGEYVWSRLCAPVPLPAAIRGRLEAKRAVEPAPPSAAPLSPLAGPPSPAAIADVDSVHVSLSLDQHVQGLTVAKPGTKHSTLVAASWAHACAAHEAHERRDAAEPRVGKLLLGALSLNEGSSVDNWSNAEAAVRSAFDRAYARPLPPRLASYELEFNDDGLARRFARLFGSTCLHVPGQGWRVWDGRRWSDQPGNGRPYELVSKMLIELHASVLKSGDEKLAKIVKDKRSAGTMGAILQLAARYLGVPFDAFDRDPYLLNCQNGTVDLRSGLLRPFAPQDLITHVASVAFDASARCDGWITALLTMQRGDVSALEYLRVLFGSFCQGTAVDGFWIMHGNGFDGKSTVLTVLHEVLGTYAKALSAQAILVAKSGQKPHTSIMGGLAGARLGTIDEMPSDCQLDTGAIKSYFGRLPVRMQTGMGKDFVDVKPTAKGLAASNHLPRVDENDFGTQRRLAVIPFDANLRALGVRKDDSFATRLVAQEGTGILAWLVSGCMNWMASSGQLPQCDRVSLATAELFSDGDAVGAFLETCVTGSDVQCTAAELYGAFKDFAENQGDYMCSKRAFGNRCRERGLSPHKGGKGLRMYAGIRPVIGKAPPT